jgi:mannose-6-phosphate isomerase-like protein (cupin superfamily)
VAPTVVWMPGGVRTEVHLTASHSAGALCLLIDEPPAGWSLPRHRHANESETIHVLAGAFEMEIGGHRTRLEAGESIHVPRGVTHDSANIGTERGKRVVIFTPAGIEGFFLEVGTPDSGTTPGGGELLAAARRWGWEFPTT